jgi:hypothetical protein
VLLFYLLVGGAAEIFLSVEQLASVVDLFDDLVLPLVLDFVVENVFLLQVQLPLTVLNVAFYLFEMVLLLRSIVLHFLVELLFNFGELGLASELHKAPKPSL